MLSARSLIVLLAAINVSYGCSPSDPASDSEKKDWPLKNIRVGLNNTIVVTSGTTFRYEGVRCRLLGVKEAEDPSIQEQARAFAEAWFKSVGNCIGAYNDTNPLVADDGAAVVWILGDEVNRACLNEELVRAGLVDLDDSTYGDYTFTTETREGVIKKDWQGILRRAKEGYQRGEKPRILFDWPPKR
jgi:hypothetical protein